MGGGILGFKRSGRQRKPRLTQLPSSAMALSMCALVICAGLTASDHNLAEGRDHAKLVLLPQSC